MTDPAARMADALAKIQRHAVLCQHVAVQGRDSNQAMVAELYAMKAPHEIASEALAAYRSQPAQPAGVEAVAGEPLGVPAQAPSDSSLKPCGHAAIPNA